MMADLKKGGGFEVVKRRENKIKQNNFSYKTGDRLVPSRDHSNTNMFRIEQPVQKFDILSDNNNFKLMRTGRYQNSLQSVLFNEEHSMFSSNPMKQKSKYSNLLREDWKCHVTERSKFLPDFETMEKRNVGAINKYLWSSQSMIAAVSNRTVCCYDPYKGYTRVIDFSLFTVSNVCFSNDGKILVVATIKKKVGSDIFIYNVDAPKIIQNGVVYNENVRSSQSGTVTSLCFTKNDKLLLLGTTDNIILIYKMNSPLKFEFDKTINMVHSDMVEHIKFSCNYTYMATLSSIGVSIWNGGSLTPTSIEFPAKYMDHIEWHPFVEDEFVLGCYEPPTLLLCSVTEKKVVASYKKFDDDLILSSFCFKKQTGELFASFHYKDKQINRVLILASMDQVIASCEFDDSYGELKLMWNGAGTMLGAGGYYFKFSFWTFFQKKNKKINKAHENLSSASAISSKNSSTKFPELKNSNLFMQLR